jgi:hypothetical protein
VADEDLDTRARLAVLAVMAWQDDRNDPGTPEGVPPAACWELAGELVRAVAPMAMRWITDRLGERYAMDAAVRRAHTWADEFAAADHTTTDQGGPDGRC